MAVQWNKSLVLAAIVVTAIVFAILAVTYGDLPRQSSDYAGPPWPIELSAPSYGLPVFFVRQADEPRRIRGYKWFRCDWSTDYRSRWILEPDPGWGLWRMHDAPKDDRATLARLNR